MARVAVVGPGAIGTTLAAWLAQGQAHDVTMCARSPVAALAVDTSAGPIVAHPHAGGDAGRGGRGTVTALRSGQRGGALTPKARPSPPDPAVEARRVVPPARSVPAK